MTSMYAVHVGDTAGHPLAWAQTPRPAPGPGQLLVRVRACGVNRADLLQRVGRYPPPPGASSILGLEIAGEVVDAGSPTDRHRIGQRVCALLDGGAYAQFAVVDRRMALPIPDGLDLDQAAAIPEAFLTAWLNLFVEGALRPGETLLVHAAASGVGTAAIQIARLRNHPVIATASRAKLPALADLGATTLLAREDAPFADAIRVATGGHGADVALDPVSGDRLADTLRALAPGGRAVVIGLLAGAQAEIPVDLLLRRRLVLRGSVLRSRSLDEKIALCSAMRADLWPAFADGRIRPLLHDVLDIRRVEEAHQAMRHNASTGKLVLRVPHE